ncbi:MAG: hypothetical protein K6E32_08185 [Lachnospiraceae bacterium]|nr:hypothetical protein [Lachnospiraceae bacterium]
MILVSNGITDNLRSFTGTGALFVLLLVALLVLFFTEKKRELRFSLVWFPIVILLLFFCPIWLLYIKRSVDGEILYRILWLIPMAVLIAYTCVFVIHRFKGRSRHLAFAAAVLVIALSGRYIYDSPLFTRAENEYHVPETVVKICNEIEVPGREIKACFPEEFVNYVRQYTPNIHLAFGRGSYMPTFNEYSVVKEILGQEYINTKELVQVLRETQTPYLIVHSDRLFSENPWKYGFGYLTNIDGYDIYLDDEAYIGLWDEDEQ